MKGLLGMLLCLVVLTPAWGYDVKTYIPKNAYSYIPILIGVEHEIWNSNPMPVYFAGLIEQESCVTLTSPTCWSPKAELRTSREEGAGFGQITRAFGSNGRVRFDTLSALRARYNHYLSHLTWGNIYQSPKLQLEAVVLDVKQIYQSLYAIPNPIQRFYFTDSAYNGGAGNVYKRRMICGLQGHCNPDKWFGNVDKICYSTLVIYGRSVCAINNQHVYNVFKVRIPKYQPFFDNFHKSSSLVKTTHKVVKTPVPPKKPPASKKPDLNTNHSWFSFLW